MPDRVGAVVSIIVIGALLLVGTAIVAPISDVTNSAEDAELRDDNVLLNGTDEVSVGPIDAYGEDPTARTSRGFAVNLTGANDSFVESRAGFDVAADDNWTVSVWGRVDPGAGSNNMTLLQVGGDLSIVYNGSEGNYSAWYYESGSRNSYRVNVSAPNQPANFTNVQVSSDGTNVSIYRNGTLGDRKNVSTALNTAPAPVNNSNWDGRVEEIRTFDNNLTASERDEIVNSPIKEQSDNNRTARVMFDQTRGSSVADVFFTNTVMELNNASNSPGFEGQVLDESDAFTTRDYVFSTDGPTLKPESGSPIDGQPVVYVEYQFKEHTFQITDRIADAFVVGSIIVIVLGASLIMGAVREIN